MSDAEWLRGIADSGWNNDEWSPEVKAMLRRVADRLDEADRLRVLNAKLVRKIDSACMTLGLGLGEPLSDQRSVGVREWREIAERAYHTLKADTKPEPKA